MKSTSVFVWAPGNKEGIQLGFPLFDSCALKRYRTLYYIYSRQLHFLMQLGGSIECIEEAPFSDACVISRQLFSVLYINVSPMWLLWPQQHFNYIPTMGTREAPNNCTFSRHSTQGKITNATCCDCIYLLTTTIQALLTTNKLQQPACFSKSVRI